ncbi:MAG: glutathione synthase [Verrucomicrobiaceae bacterium]|nr:glutathione synthase [Verrucomicrobiaceae bacterium]
MSPLDSSLPRLGVVMDPLETVRPEGDSTLAMLIAAQRRGWSLVTMDTPDLRLHDGQAMASMRRVRVFDDPSRWFEVMDTLDGSLADLDILLMRKDPPLDIDYIAATWVLDRAEADGVLVVNRPQALRDANEKIFPSWFPQCCPPTVVSASPQTLHRFLAEQKHIVLKPLDLMGGRSVHQLHHGDPSADTLLAAMTRQGTHLIQAQTFLPAIHQTGDKRILLIDGQPVPHALTRRPAAGDFRANLAIGGSAEPGELTERDLWICAQIGPELKRRGLVFAGIDVIGDWLTEINVTSPTGIRQLDRFFSIDIASQFLDTLEAKWRATTR